MKICDKKYPPEGKDPAKHDYKPEWIVFWPARIKELHEKELRVQVDEIYRMLRLPPPDQQDGDEEQKRRVLGRRNASLGRSLHRKTSSDRRKASPDRHRRSSDQLSPNRRGPYVRWSRRSRSRSPLYW